MPAVSIAAYTTAAVLILLALSELGATPPRRRNTYALVVAAVAFLFTGAIVQDASARPDIRVARATCYQLNGRTASGHWVNKRTAASNVYRLGTKFRLVGRQAGPTGVRRYIVRDTGPALSDGHFDLWAPGGCAAWGVRTIRFRLGWGR